VKIAAGIDRRDRAVAHRGFESTKLHLGGSQSSPETNPIIGIRARVSKAPENLLCRLGIRNAILEQFSILAPHVGREIVTEDAGAPGTHALKA